MKAIGIFVILLSQDGFESDCPETKFQATTSQSQFEKVTVKKSIAELWTVISNEMIKVNFLKVNESRYMKCGVTPHFSNRQNLLKKYREKINIDTIN